MIKRNLLKVGVTATAIATAGVLIAPSAVAAAPHYRIHAGSHASGTAGYTGKTVGHPGVTFSVNRQTLHCASATASGVIKLGNNVPGARLANIKKTTWKKCIGPGGLPLAVVQTQTWFLNGSGRTSAKGVTPGFINTVRARVHSVGTNACHFVVTGAVNVHYANRTHHLNVKSAGTTHRLTLSHVSCLGVIHNGAHPTFRASYAISSGRGPITIHSR